MASPGAQPATPAEESSNARGSVGPTTPPAEASFAVVMTTTAATATTTSAASLAVVMTTTTATSTTSAGAATTTTVTEAGGNAATPAALGLVYDLAMCLHENPNGARARETLGREERAGMTC